jgi:hypothetical protein
MNLITSQYIKDNFPQWQHYADFDTNADSPEDALTNQIGLAEDELAEYVTVSEKSMTDSLRRHLFHIVRYNLFLLQHADTEFERKPQIIKDYERSIQMLTQLRDGQIPPDPPSLDDIAGLTKIKAKRKRFNRWFRDIGGDTVSSTDQPYDDES